MTNKVGFTEEQQGELDKLLGIATRAARLTTESVIGTDEALTLAAGELISYIRTTYKGPVQLKSSLDEIVRFCDLPTIITAVYNDETQRP